MYIFFWLFKQIFYLCKKSKKIILLLVIFILIFMYCNNVFGYQQEILTDGSTSATIVPVQDMFNALEFQYNALECIMLSVLERAYAQGRTQVVNQFVNYIDQGYFVFYQYFNSSRIVAFLYKPSTNPTYTTIQQATYGTFAFDKLRAVTISRSVNNMVWIDYQNGVLGDFYLNDNNTYNVPQYLYFIRTELLNQFYLKYKYPSTTNNKDYSNALNEIQTTLNEQSNYLQQNIQATQQTTQAIQETTEAVNDATNAVNNLTDTVTDSNVEDSSIDLPTDSSNDITQEGIDGIFTNMYNAFCSGTAKDIVFPIPFTDKNITLSANYVRQMLSNNGGSWVITLIEAFWWYLISRFIIKDIANKVTKIKSGNIDSLENNNIKGDML